MQLNGVKAVQEGIQENEYAFHHAAKRAEARYQQLSKFYDANTIRHIEQCGIDRGWSCLEIGAGGGSIIRWLCARVGVSGRVLAIDIDPQFLENLSYPNLKVIRHDIRREGLPREEFDLAHVRLALLNISEPEKAWKQIIETLKPGGWIVVEEFDEWSYLRDPSINPAEVHLKMRHAFREVLTARGVNFHYGRLLPQELQANGLENIGAEGSASIWRAGTAGTSLLKMAARNCASQWLLLD